MFCPGLPQWLSGKESACSAGASGDASSVPGSGRSPGGGYGNPLQYSFLENPMGRGAWWTTVHWVAKSQTRLKQLSMCALSISEKQQVDEIAIFSHEASQYQFSSVQPLSRVQHFSTPWTAAR